MLKLADSAGALSSFVQPVGGLVERLSRIPADIIGVPQLESVACSSGNLGILYPPGGGLRDASWIGQRVSGTAVDTTVEMANTRSLGEVVERYCTAVVSPDEVLTATADSLGGDCLDLDLIPRCSVQEYADPKCPLTPPSKSLPIRWVPSLSLFEKQRKYVPLVMTHHCIRPKASERFWLPISTGVAAHHDLDQCILSAISEVVERDALTLAWLGRLPLPEVIYDPEDVDDELQLALAKGNRRYRLFDATTDVGLPTLYGVQQHFGHPRISQLVACATDFAAGPLRRKVLKELVQLSLAPWPKDPPEHVADFADLTDGAVHMASRERSSEFDFLLSSGRYCKPVSVDGASASPRGRLSWLLDRLRSLNCQVYLVDLTTDDVREAGLFVVRAVIPGLLPMSPMYRARYLGHPRLYDYVGERLGRQFYESDVNAAPQPFA